MEETKKSKALESLKEQLSDLKEEKSLLGGQLKEDGSHSKAISAIYARIRSQIVDLEIFLEEFSEDPSKVDSAEVYENFQRFGTSSPFPQLCLEYH